MIHPLSNYGVWTIPIRQTALVEITLTMCACARVRVFTLCLNRVTSLRQSAPQSMPFVGTPCQNIVLFFLPVCSLSDGNEHTVPGSHRTPFITVVLVFFCVWCYFCTVAITILLCTAK